MFACIGVILIHCRFPGPIGGIVKTLAKFGVPYFFMISGYFAVCTKDNDWKFERSTIKYKIKHILLLLLGVGIFYACFQLFLDDNSLSEIFTTPNMLKFIFANSPFLYSHLWFILALLYCYIFVWLVADVLTPKFAQVYIPTFAMFFLIMSILIPKFGIKIILFSSFKLYNVFFFRALPFFLFGALLKKDENHIQNWNIKKINCIAAITIGSFISLVEKVILIESQFYFGSYIVCIFLFIYCMKYQESICSRMEFMGRELTMYIYIIHIAVMKSLDRLVEFDGFYGTIYLWIRPITVILISILASYFCWDISKQYKRKCKG